MDSVLIIGDVDKKLIGFFEKIGYRLFLDKGTERTVTLLDNEVIDLIVMTLPKNDDPATYIEFLRKHPNTKDTAILALTCDKLQTLQIKDLHYERIECLQEPYTLGTVASKAATQLRLRKMVGADEGRASLSEVNAALRDLNQRFAKDLEEAQTIQKALLPKSIPQGEAFDLGVFYHPLEGVGGDWYHCGFTPSGKLLLLIADVTGHGLPAAFIGCMTKLALVAAEEEIPANLLQKMNRLMAPLIPQGRFVTGNAFLFDPTNGEVSFARAGGVAGLHFRPSTGQAHQLMGEGFPIGFFEDSEYTKEKIVMDHGDLLIIVTDGITEGQNRKGEFFGFDGIVATLKMAPPTLTAQELLKKIHDDLNDFIGGRIIKDDITMLLLRRR